METVDLPSQTHVVTGHPEAPLACLLLPGEDGVTPGQQISDYIYVDYLFYLIKIDVSFI